MVGGFVPLVGRGGGAILACEIAPRSSDPMPPVSTAFRNAPISASVSITVAHIRFASGRLSR